MLAERTLVSSLPGSHVRARSSTAARDMGGPFVASLEVKTSRKGNYIQLLQPALAGLGLWAMLLSWQ